MLSERVDKETQVALPLDELDVSIMFLRDRARYDQLAWQWTAMYSMNLPA